MSGELLAAFLIGLAGAGHCLGMCGGIASALQLGGATGLPTTLSYHAGRLASYSLLGALLGLLAGSLDLAAWTLGLRYLSGALLVAMGLYIADWWRGLLWLERGGAWLWRPVQRLLAPLLPVRHAWQAGLLGMCWGLMPCGLIYSALAFAATTGDSLSAALVMLCFGLGTLPAMLGASLGAGVIQVQLRRRGLKVAIALLLILGGLWSLYLTVSHAGHLRMPLPDMASPGLESPGLDSPGGTAPGAPHHGHH